MKSEEQTCRSPIASRRRSLPIPDGATIAVAAEGHGVAMEATRALIRRGVKGLHLVTFADLGPAGRPAHRRLLRCDTGDVRVSLGENRPGPRFTAAILARTIRMKDATCPALYAQFQAGEKGVPFMPLRGLLGSDVLAHRPDWRVIDNPFGHDDPIALLPAIPPDVAILPCRDGGPDGQRLRRPQPRPGAAGARRAALHRDGRAPA